MQENWLHIVGIGENGLADLLPATQAVVQTAEVIIGGDRHGDLIGSLRAEHHAWPEGFDDLMALIDKMKGRRVVVLATGDPLWFSIGARIGRAIDPAQITYHPQLSAFQLASVRMGWSMADLETLTVHGRPIEQMIAFIQPGARLLILTTGENTPAKIARFLTERGFGKSPMTVLAAMGGADEARFDGMAESWQHRVPAFNTLAVDCVAAPDAALLPRVPGLSDTLFQADDTLTRQEVRAVTLAKLMPMRGALLWDIGTGCGSVAIEWMRGARYTRAIGIEPQADRRAMAAANALALGVPRLTLIEGSAPEALDGLEPPDAIFIGGGLSAQIVAESWEALRPLGRMVCNALTAEDAQLLRDLHMQHGGELVKVSVERADAENNDWQTLDPVLQWSRIKR